MSEVEVITSNDQRGVGFPRKQLGRIDIGAFELQATMPPQGLVVSTNSDVVDGDFSTGQLSLREAVLLANDVTGADTITFDSSLSGATITLGGTTLELTDSVTIDASSLSGNVTIDANQSSRVFSTSTDGSFTLRRLALINGRSNGYGGAIISHGNLTLDESSISASRSSRGGGIYSAGNLYVNDSTISNNTTLGVYGGGIYNAETARLEVTGSTISGNSGSGIGNFGTAYVTNSTISNNNDDYGGGIFNRGTVQVDGSTISGNTSLYEGGGIYNGAVAVVTNSTISGNESYYGGGIFNRGTANVSSSTISDNEAYEGGGIYTSSNFHLSGSIVAANIANGDPRYSTPNLDGSLSTNTFNIIGGDPMLGPLADNGGPTLTHALLPGSPAINTGDPAAMAGVGDTPEFDQRGVGFPRVLDGRLDIGAFELGMAPSVT